MLPHPGLTPDQIRMYHIIKTVWSGEFRFGSSGIDRKMETAYYHDTGHKKAPIVDDRFSAF
jgi:hypothetical protein